MSWTEYPLDQLVDRFISGGTPNTKNEEYWRGNVPWVTGADFYDGNVVVGRKHINNVAIRKSATNIVPSGAILLVTRTGVGKMAIADQDIAISQDITGVVVKNGISTEYVIAAIRRQTKSLLNAQRGATIKGVTRDDIRNLKIPLPPPSEQQRIVEILDQADALRRKRAEADEKAQRILPALFMKMFGDAERHWSEAPISKLVEQRKGAIRTGPFGSQLRHSEFVEQGIPVLGIDNVVTNRFRWTKPRALPPEKYRQFERFRVFPEDVLLTIMGTTGRVCVAPPDLPECMSTKHLCVLTFDRQKVEPVYAWAALLFDPFVRAQVKSSGHGAIMEGWNTTIVKNLNLRVPSPDLQREFVKRARAVLSHETNSEVSADNLENVYEAVTHRAFSGDLTARWREARTDELLREAEEQARMIEEANVKGAGRTGRGRPRRAASC